jgi:hypothetical protein
MKIAAPLRDGAPPVDGVAARGEALRFPRGLAYPGTEVNAMRTRWAAAVLALLLAAVPANAGTAYAVAANAEAAATRILFMHHSTGANLIREGGVREGFSALGYPFWDHGYNEEGLVDQVGNSTGANFEVPDDNTNPDGWAAVFAQTVTTPPSTTLSQLLQYDVILFKSCFPTSNITDDEMFANYKQDYLSIRAVIDAHPDKLFVAFTPPPLVPNETEPANAERARQWAAYLASPEFVGSRKNLVVFDFFTLLADANGTLRPEYRGDEWDSHPNQRANEAIGPLLVDFVQQAIVAWRGAGG